MTSLTKHELDRAFQEFDTRVLAPIRSDIAVLQWMLGVAIAGIVTLVLKTFF
jgi:hypothetical protein